jgi:hypothetical protein
MPFNANFKTDVQMKLNKLIFCATGSTVGTNPEKGNYLVSYLGSQPGLPDISGSKDTKMGKYNK